MQVSFFCSYELNAGFCGITLNLTIPNSNNDQRKVTSLFVVHAIYYLHFSTDEYYELYIHYMIPQTHNGRK